MARAHGRPTVSAHDPRSAPVRTPVRAHGRGPAYTPYDDCEPPVTQTPAKDATLDAAPAPSGIRVRDGLMIALTLLTGAADATTFIKLGGVFTSVMTGNM